MTLYPPKEMVVTDECKKEAQERIALLEGVLAGLVNAVEEGSPARIACWKEMAELALAGVVFAVEQKEAGDASGS